MKTDVIVRDDARIKLFTSILALTNYPEKEQTRKGHSVNSLLPETIEALKEFKSLRAVKFVEDNLNEIPMYFFYAYCLSLSWPEFLPLEFPEYLHVYVPELLESDFNIYLKEFFEKSNIEELWAKQKGKWDAICNDTRLCFENKYQKELLSKFFGKVEQDLVFYPNVLVPQFMSSGGSSTKELFCIARMPGPVFDPALNPKKFSEDPIWVNIVAFHEFCHPLLDDVFRLNKEDFLRSEEIAKKISVFDKYKEHYPNWGDLFSELLIYSMTIVFLRKSFNIDIANEFTKESEEKTGIKLYSKTADILEEYLIKQEKENYKSINEYFSILIEKIIA